MKTSQMKDMIASFDKRLTEEEGPEGPHGWTPDLARAWQAREHMKKQLKLREKSK